MALVRLRLLEVRHPEEYPGQIGPGQSLVVDPLSLGWLPEALHTGGLQWRLTRSQSLQSGHGLGVAVGQPDLPGWRFLVYGAAAVGRPLQAGIQDAAARHQKLLKPPVCRKQAIAPADTP
ncbi:MAG: hypothetical protein FRX49_09311 [Trebouxia sp. A1-2]|nr:MAG: hypothetical protein FRX49_09311 [Trebouxia sp. A1-2]